MSKVKELEAKKINSLKAQKLLKSALKLFSEKDFNAVSIKDISKAAKVNTALIYYYYGNKEGLFRAVLKESVTNFLGYYENLKKRHSNPVDLIDDWFETHVQEFESITRVIKILLDYSSTRTQKKIIDNVINQFYMQERHLLVSSIKEGIALKLFKDVDPEMMSDFASTYLDGISTRSLVMKDLDVEKSIAVLRETFWSKLGYNPK